MHIICNSMIRTRVFEGSTLETISCCVSSAGMCTETMQQRVKREDLTPKLITLKHLLVSHLIREERSRLSSAATGSSLFQRWLIKEHVRHSTYKHMCVCVRPLQSAPNFEDGPSRKHRPGSPNSKDELHSPPGNGAEKWRRDGQSGMGGQ